MSERACVKQGLDAEYCNLERIIGTSVKEGRDAELVARLDRPHARWASLMQQPEHLTRTCVQGAAVTVGTQALRFCLQTGSMMILARLLSPDDFGVQGMVLALIGVLNVFKDAGLSTATVQRDVVTHEQASTLFWINFVVGGLLSVVTFMLAFAMVDLYREPRLLWVASVSGTVFLFSGLTAQHRALLQRSMRFITASKIDITALAISSGVGIGMAISGYGYWALVGATVAEPIVGGLGAWWAIRWIPGLPRRGTGLRSMLHFGGTVMLNNLVVYVGYNTEKVLLGRFWGAATLGLYGRAYQLINLPTTQLHGSIFPVMFPVLARLQAEPVRLCRAFLKGYSVLLSLTVPMTVFSVLFADEIVYVVLGPKWDQAVPVFRLLGPTVLALGLINPFGWLLIASGRNVRSLNMALVIAPLVIIAVATGVRNGPIGVALNYSLVMSALVVPLIAWAKRGMELSTRDMLTTIKGPALAGLLAGAFGFVFRDLIGHSSTAIMRLSLGGGLVAVVYTWTLLIAFGQKDFYAHIIFQLLQKGTQGRNAAVTTMDKR